MSLRIALVGICAGAAAALLFGLLTTGSLISALLVYLAPLPMLIAGIGWSHWAALIAAVFGGLAIAVLFGPIYLFAFLAGAGLPAWWLSYLTLLARPAGNGIENALEWYPPGRLVMWAALAAILVVCLGILYSGPDAATFRAHMHKALATVLRVENGDSTVSGARDMQRLLDFLVDAAPPAAAVLATATNALNLWLAARIVKLSGRLARPWPHIAAMTLPRPLLAALLVAIALSFAGGLIGILASATTAGLLMAYGVLGFAVLHIVTQENSARGLLLGGAYAAVLVFGWPMLVLCLLGLLEATIDLRARFAHKRSPPPSPL